jgi:hypothetical protein
MDGCEVVVLRLSWFCLLRACTATVFLFSEGCIDTDTVYPGFAFFVFFVYDQLYTPEIPRSSVTTISSEILDFCLHLLNG